MCPMSHTHTHMDLCFWIFGVKFQVGHTYNDARDTNKHYLPGSFIYKDHLVADIDRINKANEEIAVFKAKLTKKET